MLQALLRQIVPVSFNESLLNLNTLNFSELMCPCKQASNTTRYEWSPCKTCARFTKLWGTSFPSQTLNVQLALLILKGIIKRFRGLCYIPQRLCFLLRTRIASTIVFWFWVSFFHSLFFSLFACEGASVVSACPHDENSWRTLRGLDGPVTIIFLGKTILINRLRIFNQLFWFQLPHETCVSRSAQTLNSINNTKFSCLANNQSTIV